METYQEYHIVKETHQTGSDRDAARETARSRNTSGVAIAAASGVAVRDYVRTVLEDQRSEVTWALENGKVRFVPEFAEEEISVAEILRRANDQDWLLANPHHPISYMAAALQANRRLVEAIRTKKPLIAFRRGKSTVYLVPGGDPERGRRLLEKATFSYDEIETICQELYPHEA